MMQIGRVSVKGCNAQSLVIQELGGAEHPNLILIQCVKGYLMCGYLNMEAAERFGDAAVLVSGADVEEVLHNPVKGMTTAAAQIGVKEGMTGAEAAEVLNTEEE